jgi:parallel beta-helix repeat protein
MSKLERHLLRASLALAVATGALAQFYSFAPIDVPEAIYTGPFGMTSNGTIVGYSQSGVDKKYRGFLWARGAQAPTQVVDVPDSQWTYAIGANNAGQAVGWCADQKGAVHGFLFSGGKYTLIDHPDPKTFYTVADGINEAGDIVGGYNSLGSPSAPAGAGLRGYLLSKGTFTTIEMPGAVWLHARGINAQGDAVGYFQDGNNRVHGFLLKKGQTTPVAIDYPGAFRTDVTGITPEGDIGGRYKRTGDSGREDWHGLVLSRTGEFTPVNVVLPGVNVRYTRVRGVSSTGEIVGDYYDNDLRTVRGFLARPTPPASGLQALFVDDDGAQCPGSVRTIQEAVANASRDATILVCPGLYRHTVQVTGHAKDGLRLIATGHAGEVVLQGDHTERDGLHLEEVDNVLIRGFTVRNFGNKPTIATEWGEGNNIALLKAHYNTIEHNWLLNAAGTGILLADSGNNLIQQNTVLADDQWLATAGIQFQGADSANNFLGQNLIHGNQVAGIVIRGAGPGNSVTDNTVVGNGRFGIDVQNTNDIWIEGNRVSYNRGFWGTTPGGQQPGLGINLVNVNKATVFDNRARNNSGVDLSWDGKGENKLDANACEKSTPAGACAR